MRHDDSYLLDMLVAAHKAARFAEGLTWERFLRSDLHQNAILKVLEIIGEAASRISADTGPLTRTCRGRISSDSGIGLCMPTSTLIWRWCGISSGMTFQR